MPWALALLGQLVVIARSSRRKPVSCQSPAVSVAPVEITARRGLNGAPGPGDDFRAARVET
jgi:hypothetical protein